MVNLDQDLIGDLGRQGAIFGGVFEEVISTAVAQVAIFKNEGLAHQVIRLIIQILGGESGLINPVEIQLTLVNVMLFDQLNRLRFVGWRQVLLPFGVLTFGVSHRRVNRPADLTQS